MSGIALFRIDERLVHGQVVTAWLGHTKAQEIIVVDDATANDSLLCSVVKMAVPSSISASILTIEKALSILPTLTEEDKVMVIVKNPQSAKKILEGIGTGIINEINVGNAGMAAGRSKLTDSVYLNEEAIKELEQIADIGYQVYFQTIPSTGRQALQDVLKKLRGGV